MRGIGLIFVLMIIGSIGCKDLGIVAPSEVGLAPTAASGKFVVDEYSVECHAKVNPRNDSVQAWFPVQLLYHFEGSAGSVSMVTFMFDEQLGVTLAIDGWPDSVGVLRSLTPSYWTTTQLAQKESVLVKCKLSGSYAIYVDGYPRATNSWSWSTERRVAVRH
jgi:hypothetical protein